ncbi:MAG: sigma-70 family RNA polymerase sigma factor [Phycisphaeraceae bacterium]|nr:sigma-70 family RNA polymerase sigma factor [Phycisphaeraceae bacterium]
MPDADSTLVQRACAGDADALTELLRRNGPELRRRVESRIGRQWNGVIEADDVLQVTYLEAFTRIARFTPEGEGAFLAWMTRIAENNVRDAVRGLERAKRPDPKRRVQGPVNEDSYVGLVEVLGVTTTTPSRQAARREAVEILDRTLAKLPTDYAKVVRLYDLECRPIAEVARELGRSEGAVYMLRARAHDWLRETMGTESQFFSVS